MPVQLMDHMLLVLIRHRQLLQQQDYYLVHSDQLRERIPCGQNLSNLLFNEKLYDIDVTQTEVSERFACLLEFLFTIYSMNYQNIERH